MTLALPLLSRLALAPLLLLVAMITAADAHEIRPAVATVDLADDGAVELNVVLNLEAYVAGVAADHSDTEQSPAAGRYEELRAAPPDLLEEIFTPTAGDLAVRFTLGFDDAAAQLRLAGVDIPPVGDLSLARQTTLTFVGAAPPGAATLQWRAPEALGDTVIRVRRAGEPRPFASAYVNAGATSETIPLAPDAPPDFWRSLASYVEIGFVHIVPKGLDHILFVVGLFLLSQNFRPLLWQVTGFTLAHSITLALGVYGIVRAPPSIVEPLIAASIVFIAVENLFTDRLQVWRPFVVFNFGLLHGLGFAGVLTDVGLPRDQFVAALVGFNIGVELGQLAVIAACFLAVGFWLRRHWYRRVIAIPASAAIALTATFWFFERTF